MKDRRIRMMCWMSNYDRLHVMSSRKKEFTRIKYFCNIEAILIYKRSTFCKEDICFESFLGEKSINIPKRF